MHYTTYLRVVEVRNGLNDFHFYNKSNKSECWKRYNIAIYPVKFTNFALPSLRCHFGLFHLKSLK